MLRPPAAGASTGSCTDRGFNLSLGLRAADSEIWLIQSKADRIQGFSRFFKAEYPNHQGPIMYLAKPSYSHCAELSRTDRHFSTATGVKKTVTPPTNKTRGVYAICS